MHAGRQASDLANDRRGIALIEMALILPLLLLAIMGLAELCNYVLQKQRVSQLALQIADNAGRLGVVGLTGPRKLTETEVNDVLVGSGVGRMGGGFEADSRIILSSLEMNKDKGQWIHWQRCWGDLAHPSSFGVQSAGANGTAFPGMGPAGARILAEAEHPVMFVEVGYRLRPLTPLPLMKEQVIIETAAMPVRVDRDLAGLDNAAQAPVSVC